MLDKRLGNNADLAYCKAARKRFEKLKLTPEFKHWKHWQFNMQRGQCAWCGQMMKRDYTGVHVDHALPLIHGGSNKYSNLVLAHARCNMSKWIRIDGVPQWIVNNQEKWRAKKERQRLRQAQQQQIERLEQEAHDEQLVEQMRDWI